MLNMQLHLRRIGNLLLPNPNGVITFGEILVGLNLRCLGLN